MWVWKMPGKIREKAGYFFEVGMSGSLVDPEWAKRQSDWVLLRV